MGLIQRPGFFALTLSYALHGCASRGNDGTTIRRHDAPDGRRLRRLSHKEHKAHKVHKGNRPRINGFPRWSRRQSPREARRHQREAIRRRAFGLLCGLRELCVLGESAGGRLSNWPAAPNSTPSSCVVSSYRRARPKATPEGGVRANSAEDKISVLEGVRDLTARAGQR